MLQLQQERSLVSKIDYVVSWMKENPFCCEFVKIVGRRSLQVPRKMFAGFD